MEDNKQIKNSTNSDIRGIKPKIKNAEIIIKNGEANEKPSDSLKTDATKKPTKKKKKSVLFVCTGNTCRSAMAQYIFLDVLKRKGLDSEYTASSAGIAAQEGDGMMENAKAALSTLSIPFKKHKAKQITQSLVKKSYLVVCMTQMHKMALESVGAECVTVGQIVGTGDILDPYGQNELAYLKTAEALLYASDEIIDYILKKKNTEKY